MADMEISVGITDERALRQMAALEARMKRAAKEGEAAFAKANAGVLNKVRQQEAQAAAQMRGFMGQYKNQMQQFGYQMTDVVTQVNAGTAATQALSMQLPQLLGGFGALGATLGVVAAVAIPLAGSLIQTGDGAEELATATDNASKALDAYRAAVADAGSSSAELAARFGDAAGSARKLLEVIALSAQTEALVAQREVLDSLNERFADLQNRVTAYQNVLASGDAAGAMGWAEDIQDKFGLAIDEAVRLADIISQLNSTTDQSQRNQLMVDLVTILNDAARSGQDVNAELAKSAGEAARAGLAVEEIGAAASSSASDMAALADEASALGDYLRDAAGAVSALQGAINGLSIGNVGRAAQLAALKAGNSAADAAIAGKVAERQAELHTTFNPDDANITGLQRELSQYEQTLREEARLTAEIAALEKSLEPKPGGGSGRTRRGRSRSGGGGERARREERPFFESIERDAIALQRQIELLGKSGEEAATARARWELLDEAKKRGITVNETLNAQIEAQAAQVGRLTGELERAEISQRQFDDAINGIASDMSGALLQGESLRDGLADVFQGIAADILNSGIRDALMRQFGGGGFGGILGSIFGGVRGNDALSQALRNTGGFGGFRAMGGPVSPSQWHVVGENGPEIFVPQSAGSIIPNHDIRRGGGGATFNINVSGTGNAEVMAAAEQGMNRALQQYDRTLPSRVLGINRDPRKRYS